MRYFLIVILFIILFITLIVWTKTKITLYFYDNELKIVVRNLFLKFSYPRKKEVKEKVEEVAKEGAGIAADSVESDLNNIEKKLNKKGFNFQEIKDIVIGYKYKISLIKKYSKKVLSYLRYKIEIRKLKIVLEFGTGDAADTGLACGVFWALYGNIYAVLTRYFKLDRPNISLTPDYNEKTLKIGVESIIELRIAHIINAFFIVLAGYLKYFKINKCHLKEKGV